MKKLTIFLTLAIGILITTQFNMLVRVYDGAKLYLFSKDHKQFYVLNASENIVDITNSLKVNQSIPLTLRQPLINGERRIYVFKYKSDGNDVAGYLSLLTKGQHPSAIFLRGGNGNFGILRPNNTFSYLDGYNIIGTLYRGNIYGGVDEFGGKDIHDIENLIQFLPQLERQIDHHIAQPTAMIGVSRGAMQMFVTLSKSPIVKRIIKKAIAISGNTDLKVAAAKRSEMLYLFKQKFKTQNQQKTLESWISSRNPVDLSSLLETDLQVLLIYGSNDNRVDISEQLNFIKALNRHKIHSTFIQIDHTGHTMEGHLEKVKQLIVDFLNRNNHLSDFS